MASTTLIRKGLEPILAAFLAGFMIHYMAAKLVAIIFLARDLAVMAIAFLSLAHSQGWDVAFIGAIKNITTLLKVLNTFRTQVLNTFRRVLILLIAPIKAASLKVAQGRVLKVLKVLGNSASSRPRPEVKGSATNQAVDSDNDSGGNTINGTSRLSCPSSATESAPSDDSVMTDQDETVDLHRSPPLTNTDVSADLHCTPPLTNKDEPVTEEDLPSPDGAQIEAPSSSSCSQPLIVNTAQGLSSIPSYSCCGDVNSHQSSSISPSSVSINEELQQPSLEDLLTPLDEYAFDVTCCNYHVLGFGAYGLVRLVALVVGQYRRLAALKVLNTATTDPDMIRQEVGILRMLDGVTFVTNLLRTMQFSNQFCLLLPLGPANMEQRVVDQQNFDDGSLMGGAVFLGGEIGWRRPGMCMSELQFHAACLLIGLRDIHRRNVVHRDIKPENILIGEDGYPMFADFGLADVLRPGEKTDTYKGTPGYLAPEVASYYVLALSKYKCPTPPPRIERSTDHWSLGVTMFRMRTGMDSPYLKWDGDGSFDLEATLWHTALAPQFSSLPGAAYLPKATHQDREFFDFLSKLLDPCSKSRLGSEENPSRPEDHPFLRGVDWAALEAKQLPAPWRPSCRTEDLPNMAAKVPWDHPAHWGQ